MCRVLKLIITPLERVNRLCFCQHYEYMILDILFLMFLIIVLWIFVVGLEAHLIDDTLMCIDEYCPSIVYGIRMYLMYWWQPPPSHTIYHQILRVYNKNNMMIVPNHSKSSDMLSSSWHASNGDHMFVDLCCWQTGTKYPCMIVYGTRMHNIQIHTYYGNYSSGTENYSSLWEAVLYNAFDRLVPTTAASRDNWIYRYPVCTLQSLYSGEGQNSHPYMTFREVTKLLDLNMVVNYYMGMSLSCNCLPCFDALARHGPKFLQTFNFDQTTALQQQNIQNALVTLCVEDSMATIYPSVLLHIPVHSLTKVIFEYVELVQQVRERLLEQRVEYLQKQKRFIEQ